MNANIINQYCPEQAAAGDWAAVAAALQAVTVTQSPRNCFGAESADAIDAAGPRRRSIMAAMRADADGAFLLAKLAADGVQWAHHRTVAFMDAMVSAKAMDAADKSALVELSAPTTRPYSDATAEQCRVAWQSQQLQSEWTAMLNDGGINAAVASGDRAALVVALTSAADKIGAV